MCFRIVTGKVPVYGGIGRSVRAGYLLMGLPSTPSEIVAIKVLEALPGLQNLSPLSGRSAGVMRLIGGLLALIERWEVPGVFKLHGFRRVGRHFRGVNDMGDSTMSRGGVPVLELDVVVVWIRARLNLLDVAPIFSSYLKSTAGVVSPVLNIATALGLLGLALLLLWH